MRERKEAFEIVHGVYWDFRFAEAALDRRPDPPQHAQKRQKRTHPHQWYRAQPGLLEFFSFLRALTRNDKQTAATDDIRPSSMPNAMPAFQAGCRRNAVFRVACFKARRELRGRIG